MRITRIIKSSNSKVVYHSGSLPNETDLFKSSSHNSYGVGYYVSESLEHIQLYHSDGNYYTFVLSEGNYVSEIDDLSFLSEEIKEKCIRCPFSSIVDKLAVVLFGNLNAKQARLECSKYLLKNGIDGVKFQQLGVTNYCIFNLNKLKLIK